MAEQNNNLFNRLKRLFGSSVVIRKTRDNQLVVKDVDFTQMGLTTNFIDRYTRVSSGAGWGRKYSAQQNAKNSYEIARNELFRDFEQMDSDPILSSALDIYSDESNITNVEGSVLSIKTDNAKLHRILHNLFFDILNIEFNLWSWLRNLTKYGDFFLLLDIADKYGILSVKPLSPYDVIRLEDHDPSDPKLVQYEIAGASDRNITPQGEKKLYENYEIAHFRLLSDSNFLPYGKSMLEGARKVWKQLTLMEDAMLIHRIMRAPEKRIFKIDIGNIPPNEVDNYMQKIINRMKKIPVIDQTTGEFNLRYNVEPIAWYSKIPLVDGRTITIKDLAKEHEQGKKNYVYSVDRDNNNSIRAGEVVWCGLTKKNANIVRVTINDNSYVDFEPEHPIMLSDGEYILAKNIQPGDSLMPFYTNISSEKNIGGYEKVFNPETNSYNFTHRVVANQYNIDNYINTSNVIHHSDFNKLNNIPENLTCTMTFEEYIRYHGNNASEMWNSETESERVRINHSVKSVEFLTERCDVYCMEVKDFHNFAIDSHGGVTRDGFFVKNSVLEDYYMPVRGGDSGTEIDTLPGLSNDNAIDDIEYLRNKMMAALKIPKAFLGYEEGLSGGKCLHPDTKIPLLDGKTKTIKEISDEFATNSDPDWWVYSYDVKTDSIIPAKIKMAEQTRKDAQLVRVYLDNDTHIDCTPDHNFVLKGGDEKQAQQLACGDSLQAVYRQNKKIANNSNEYEQIYQPNNHKVVRVEWLNERVDTYNMEVDNENHNYLLSTGIIIKNSTLAAEDVRFARTIERLQKIVVAELEKIAIIHLYTQGFSGVELLNFDLRLTNPSMIHEQEKLELLNQQVDIAQSAIENKLFSQNWIYENIFDLNEHQKKKLMSEIAADSKQKFRHTQIEDEGNDPFETGEKVDDDDENGASSLKGDWGGSEKDPQYSHHDFGNATSKDRKDATKYEREHFGKREFKGGSPLYLGKGSTIVKSEGLLDQLKKKFKNQEKKSGLLSEDLLFVEEEA